jgi:glycine dehydrogenase subunit 1
MTTMGRRGLQEVAEQCARKAAYARRHIAALEGYTLPYSAPVFNEFVVRGPVGAEGLLRRLAEEHNVTGGLALSRYFPDRPNEFLVCVTEVNKRSEIEALVAGLSEIRA